MMQPWGGKAEGPGELRVGRSSLAGQFRWDGQPTVRKTLLVVDDEPEVMAVVMEIFHMDGFEVESAANGEVALAKLEQRFYDVIVSDIRMPRMDGVTLYHAIKQRYPVLLQRFIFLTGDTGSPKMLDFLEETRLPFVSKPFPLEVIRQAVRSVLDAAE